MKNLPFSMPVVAIAIASIHYTYSPRNGQAEFAWVTGLNIKMVYP